MEAVLELVYGVRYVITYAVRHNSVKTMTPRTRRPRGSLTPDAILDAAEAVAQEGFDALSMRAVAARLGAAPMALYNHFATKDELVEALLDRVLRASSRRRRPTTGRTTCGMFARAHRRLLLAHPWAITGAVSQPQPRVSARSHRRARAGDPARGGLSGAPAVATFGGILSLNYGWSSFTTARDPNPDRRASASARCCRRCRPTSTR